MLDHRVGVEVAELARHADEKLLRLHAALECDLALALIGLDAGQRRDEIVCQDLRRFSPSVIDLSPVASCFLIRISISRSSTAFNCSGVISPFSRLARASFRGLERSRLPTWSARKGGLVRCIFSYSF